MIHFWESEDYKDLNDAKTFADMVPIAIRVIDRMPDPVRMISGPISTGGRGSIEENLHFFSVTINLLYNTGISVFDQTIFDDVIQDRREKMKHDGYCMPLLEEFYLPIFKTGKIDLMYFLPDWESSFGAKWEREQCKILNIEIKEYPEELLKGL